MVANFHLFVADVQKADYKILTIEPEASMFYMRNAVAPSNKRRVSISHRMEMRPLPNRVCAAEGKNGAMQLSWFEASKALKY